MNDPVIQVRSLEHRFPESGFTLHLPKLDIHTGEVLAVIGPNGAGKSTLLRLAAGILRPGSGSIQLLGRDLSRLDRRTAARSLGYLPQDLNSNSDYRVEELAALGRYPHFPPFGNPGTKDRRIIEESLRSTEMDNLRHRRLSHLSGGERKRAFLASVLAQNPRILLLDEPAASLDLHRQGHFFQLLTDLARRGMGIVAVTHDLNLASLFSRRILMLKNGSPLAEGPPDTVLSPDNLESAYGPDIWLGRHPQTGRPIVLPDIKDEIP